MPLVFVKVCGLRTAEAALVAADSGADLLGLIFAKSKRQLTLDQARDIASALRQRYPTVGTVEMGASLEQEWRHAEIIAARQQLQRPLLVGVFADQSADFINEIALAVPLDLIQLHGQAEPVDFPSQLRRPCIRAIHVLPSDDVASVHSRLEAAKGNAALCLLDTGVQGAAAQGGFDWTIATALAADIPFLMAGGLNKDNVSNAISVVRPFGVDVSSGVEDSTTLQKDPVKVRQFVAAAKSVSIDR